MKKIYETVKAHQFAFLIFAVGAFFRLYNGPGRYVLGGESIRDASVGIIGAEQLQFPLTGPFSSLGQFTFGPWYWYFLIIGNIIFPTVYTSWFVLGIFSVATIIIYYCIGNEVKGKTLGIILSIIATLSQSPIISVVLLTNPNMLHFFAALSVYLFILSAKKYNRWLIFFMGIALGIGANIHYQMIGLFLLPVALCVLQYRRILPIILISSAGIILTFLPLLFFDLNNHWYTVSHIWYFLQHGKDAIYVPNRWLFYIRDFWPALWADIFGIPAFLSYPMIAFVSLYVVLGIYRRRFSKLEIVLALVFLFEFIRLRYHWGERFFGYLHYLHPFIFLFTSLVFYSIISSKRFKIAGILILVIFVLFLGYQRTALLKTDYYTKEYEDATKKLESDFPNEQIAIYSCLVDPAYSHSIMFLLFRDRRLGDGGKKIGFFGEKCIFYPDLPDNQKPPAFDVMLSLSVHADSYVLLDAVQMVDISSLDEETIKSEGWEQVTPESIFTSSTRWWFEEQP